MDDKLDKKEKSPIDKKKQRNRFIVIGICFWGFPFAYLMSFIASSTSDNPIRYTGFDPKLFLLMLIFSLPISLAGGAFWGYLVWRALKYFKLGNLDRI